MTKQRFNEDALSERPAIEQLKRLGYTHIHGDNLDPELREDCERKSRRDAILEERLKRKLREINPLLNEESIIKAIRRITHIHTESTLEANQIFHRFLISGTSVDQDIGGRRQKQTVNYVDFEEIEKNEFLTVNQFWLRNGKIIARPDIVIFINGIPVVVIECKSPVAKNTGVAIAQRQLIRYQEEIPQLFRTNEILVGCNLFGAKYGMIDVTPEKYHEWKAQNGEKFPDMNNHPSVIEMLKLGMIEKKDLSAHPPMQEVLIAGLLKKQNLLDIVRNFVVFDYSKEEHKIVKKICRYQQYSAVNKLIMRVVGEPHKRGIVWHWQGSGKSLIMLFAATKLKREEKKLKNPNVLIVTDRIKLDNQITDQFRDCNFPNPIQSKTARELYSLLGSGTSGNTVMTTVQKFRKPHVKPLSEAENIIVMTDEAHRTQYGNFALNLRKALPNASFFAFTGTPLDKRDRNTYRHFSPPGERYLDRYDMQQSLEDGATVPIKYESRLANLQVVGASIDALIRELFPDKTKKELAEIKRRYATIETVISAPRRIERVAVDIVDHFMAKIAPNGFKAQIVASERKTAVMYKGALDKLIDPSWSEIIMTVNSDDPLEWKKRYRRTPVEEEAISGKERFLNPSHPLKFLIVCDKLLTGFDAPIEQVMYLDQRMKEHTLLQAVARTNRPYPRKNFGLVVDYIGVGKELAKALSIFDEEDLRGLFSVDDIKREVAFLKAYHGKAISFFKNVRREGKPQDVIQKCIEIIRSEDVRAEFEDSFRAFAKSIDILMPDPAVDPYLKDFKFLGLVREGARNLYRDERLSLENCSKKVESLIHAHIADIGVEQILEAVDITAPDFEEKLEVKGSLRAKASHVEQAIRETISSKISEDPHFYESLQEKLEFVIKEDRARRKGEAEFLMDLLEIKKQEEKRGETAEEKNLDSDEYAFYGMFAPYGNVLFGEDDEKRCELAREVVRSIKDRRVVDWAEKEDVKKEMRREIKDLLRKINFRAEELERFVRELIELAEKRF
jgi:type I restriction enzyme R subunit